MQPTSPVANRIKGCDFNKQINNIDLLQKQAPANPGFEQRRFDLLELVNNNIEKFKKNSTTLDLIYNKTFETETNRNFDLHKH